MAVDIKPADHSPINRGITPKEEIAFRDLSYLLLEMAKLGISMQRDEKKDRAQMRRCSVKHMNDVAGSYTKQSWIMGVVNVIAGGSCLIQGSTSPLTVGKIPTDIWGTFAQGNRTHSQHTANMNDALSQERTGSVRDLNDTIRQIIQILTQLSSAERELAAKINS